MGVWIETGRCTQQSICLDVTPFVGVWIETYRHAARSPPNLVTPFVGVWIETENTARLYGNVLRHTLRGCVD